MKTRSLLWVYIIVAIANLLAQIFGSAELNQYTKPVLMPVLLFFVYESTKGQVTMRVLLLCLAIFLSWVGDLALLYGSELIYFLIGIGFFLFAQITYIVVLNKSSFQKLAFDVLKILPFALYALALFKLLLPQAGDLLIPILIYGIVISIMAGTARLREGNTSQESYRLALYGSILFVISDSILAFNKFYSPIPISGFWIMSTYLAAQLLLVKGILKHVE